MQHSAMLGLYPGTFDPVTRGHLDIMRRSLGFCAQLVVGVGGNKAKQPLFTPEERSAFVEQAIVDELPELASRIAVRPYAGATVGFAQAIGASLIVKGLRNPGDYAHEETMAAVNRRIDPGIDSVFLFADNALRHVSSSTVREMARAGIAPEHFDPYVTFAVRDALLARLA